MENIKLFLNFAWRIGLPSSTLFTSSDLYQRRGLTEVLRCLEALARHTTTLKSWTGPEWKGGPKGPSAKRQSKHWWGVFFFACFLLFLFNYELNQNRFLRLVFFFVSLEKKGCFDSICQQNFYSRHWECGTSRFESWIGSRSNCFGKNDIWKRWIVGTKLEKFKRFK